MDWHLSTIDINFHVHGVGIGVLLIHWTSFIMNLLSSKVSGNLEPENVTGKNHEGKLGWEQDHVDYSGKTDGEDGKDTEDAANNDIKHEDVHHAAR